MKLTNPSGEYFVILSLQTSTTFVVSIEPTPRLKYPLSKTFYFSTVPLPSHDSDTPEVLREEKDVLRIPAWDL